MIKVTYNPINANFFIMIIYFSERLINLQQVITNLQPDIIMARIEKVEIHFYILITELYSLWMFTVHDLGT